MVDERLIKYIKQQLDQGQNISNIRNTLVRYGNSPGIVDQAVNSIFLKKEVKHTIHFSPATTISVIAILVTITLVSSLFYFMNQSPKQLLDVNINSDTPNVEPGNYLNFKVELLNLGSKNRYDILLKHEIINSENSIVLTKKTETVAIETRNVIESQILVPEDADLGNYALETTASYKGKKATSSILVRIIRKDLEPTCTDGIKNQGETKTDCGGPCPVCPSCNDNIKNQGEQGIDCGGPCESCDKKCDDKNSCTTDIFKDGACTYKEIKPCCGNLKCETNENYRNCAQDCEAPQDKDIFEGLTIWEKLDKIRNISKTNAEKAERYCTDIEEYTYRDECFANLGDVTGKARPCDKITDNRTKDRCLASAAKQSKDSDICAKISQESRRDSCYMNFVLDNKDYTVCDKIINKYLKDSCDTLQALESQAS